jgi:hypothetical protein
MLWCVPGMGTILWGASPLYIIRKGVKVTTLKSTSRRQGWKGDRPSEGSRRANLRADGQKSHTRPNPRASQHHLTKPIRNFWGMVNAAVVQEKIMLLPGEICQPKLLNGSGGTVPARARVNMAEVSRGREPGFLPGERSEGSVIGRCS